MTTPNEELRAHALHVEAMLGELLRHDADETHPRIKALRAAIAALARKEEGREAGAMYAKEENALRKVVRERFGPGWLIHACQEAADAIANLRVALVSQIDITNTERRLADSAARKLREQPAPATPQAGESAPIAWRFRYFDKETNVGFWRHSHGEPQPSYETGDLGFEKQPLYAAPASPQGVSDAVVERAKRASDRLKEWRKSMPAVWYGNAALDEAAKVLDEVTAAGAAPKSSVRHAPRRYHSGYIGKLMPNEIFVFGSNLAGIHGAGAARFAKERFGAKQGEGEGPTGQCYAFPTKNRAIATLSLGQIKLSAEEFVEYAEHHPEQQFLLTAVGCGLAGLHPRDIAPMFAHAPDNVVFPPEFKPYEQSR